MSTNRINKLLDYVVSFPHAQQKQFLLALYKTGQIHLINLIVSNGSYELGSNDENWPFMPDPRHSVLTENWSKVKESLDTKNGLLDEMFSASCINKQHKQAVELRTTNACKNEVLLNILRRRSIGDYNKFLTCLVKTKQLQAAYLLRAKIQPGYEPLTAVQESILMRNYSSLIQLIDSRHDLVAKMYAADCITWRQKDFIETASSQAKRNMRLLNFMEKNQPIRLQQVFEMSRSHRTETHLSHSNSKRSRCSYIA
jgi:Caspase recruitment domain